MKAEEKKIFSDFDFRYIKITRHVLSFLTLITFFGITLAAGKDIKAQSSHPSRFDDTNAFTFQDQSQNEQSESSISSLYIQFNTSGLYSSLTDWKNQNFPSGSNPSTNSIVFGGECGWLINKYVQIGIGYEFFFTNKATTRFAAGDQINSTFFYGTARVEMPLESVSDLSILMSVDIGSMTATEVLENYSGLYFDRGGSTPGYRVMLGAQYFIIDNWSIMAEGGYLAGKVNKITVSGQAVTGQVWPDYSLDLSGFIIRFAVNYHIPF